MARYLEVDRSSLLPIGLLSASIQSVLSQLQRDRTAKKEQQIILQKAIELATDIQNGEIKKPSQGEYMSLPRPEAAKARKFAVRAWMSSLGAPANGQKSGSEFDGIIGEYLRLFEQVKRTGELSPENDARAAEAKEFFRKLNRVVVGNLNDLPEQRAAAEALVR
jgi:hypothetical protein